ncbi:MAG: hypothetical protein Ct9H300mP14_17140 [Gammaproteobacteria bacterium]|nr:MAG: hypothetical protein Ct9H300mP14_17140 [Gammaproteobacteria bacterium]
MKIARVIGSVSGTIKDSPWWAKTLLVNVVEQWGFLNPSQVATDTCGSGIGDMVL